MHTHHCLYGVTVKHIILHATAFTSGLLQGLIGESTIETYLPSEEQRSLRSGESAESYVEGEAGRKAVVLDSPLFVKLTAA